MSSHNVTNEQLVQFVLGDLPPQEAQGIEAHLRQCDPCRQEAGRLQSLLGCAGRMSNVPEDERIVQSANREVLLAARTEIEDQSHRGTRSMVLLGRMIMSSQITKLAAAAVVCLAAVVGLNVFTGDGAGKVYARAISQLQRAQVLTYSAITRTGMKDMPTVRTNVAFKSAGDASLFRITTPDGYTTVAHAIGNKITGLTIVPLVKNFVRFELENVPKDPARDPWVTIETLRALPEQADEVLGSREVDGQMLEGFRVHGEDLVTTVWIDPASERLARVELEVPSAPGMNVIVSDFQFDTPLEDSFFSLEPPQGYVQLDIQADVASVGEKDFVEFLRAWSQWTVDGTFPPVVSGLEVAKVVIQMAQEGKFKPGWDFGRQQIMYRGLTFAGMLPSGMWRYAGQNIPFGDAAVPIFWYQPQGSATWRVIYADLHVAETAPENLLK
jgi:anti-sigma factor RsiW